MMPPRNEGTLLLGRGQFLQPPVECPRPVGASVPCSLLVPGLSRFQPANRVGDRMNFRDSRLWYGVVGVLVVLLVIAYGAGWFGGVPTPPLTPTPTPQ